MQTHTVRIDPRTGRLDARKLCDLLMAVEDYIAADKVDMDDEAALVATNLLIRHFGSDGDTPEAQWLAQP